METKNEPNLTLSDANGREIPTPNKDRAYIYELGITDLQFRAEDYPKQDTSIFIKDNSAFSHRGLPRKKRR